ncbi:hypothetical protein GI374_17845 [Paracoccus sp. S-4012]|nr:hypothetical protein [Paracoccus sp. S-4012]MRX52220.1 hypothetical protein [Paracoccus sp. S-4012]
MSLSVPAAFARQQDGGDAVKSGHCFFPQQPSIETSGADPPWFTRLPS